MAHATLSPSSSSRWLTCTASVQAVANAIDSGEIAREESSSYAREGTIAHSLGEIEASHKFGITDTKAYLKALKLWRKEFDAEGLSHEAFEEMRGHIGSYLNLIEERLNRFPSSTVLFEERVDTGVPGSWGTSDVVIVSPSHVEIIDLKYGAGVPVSATGNTQLRLYGLGALDTFGDMLGDTEIVRMTVFQPRVGNTSTEELSADELRAWREETAIPAAEEALSGDGVFSPSDEACRWCPLAGICRARMEKNVQDDFGSDPETISPEEISDVLTRIPEIRAWCSAVEDYALDALYSKGKEIPGWKAVMSGGSRYIPDSTAAIQTLIDAGFPAEKVSEIKIKGVGALEKLVGKAELPDVLGDLLTKRPGKPAIATEDDKRPAINPESDAAKDFG